MLTELLTELGTVPKELYEKINKETNVDRLKFWAKLAAKAESLEQFLAKM